MSHAAGARALPLLHDLLADSVRRAPAREALVAGGIRWSYAELGQRADAMAGALADRGVGRGDRVLILGDNRAATVVAFWGSLAANAVPVVVSPQTKRDKLAYLLADCRPRALVADASLGPTFSGPAASSPHLAAVLVDGDADATALAALPGGATLEEAVRQGSRGAPPPRRAIDQDLAAILYTSGSTGEPKGVMQTHQSMRAAARSVSQYLDNGPDDVILCALPLSFDYGLYQAIMAAAVGASVVLERSFAFPARVLERVAQERITAFPGVPTVFAMLRDLPGLFGLDLSSVRYVTNTAAALPPKHIAFLRELFPSARIYSMYGLTECKRVSYVPPERLADKPDSVGLAIPGTELWIEGDGGRRLGPGEVGEIVVRGATVMRGYWDKPEASDRRLGPGPLPGERVLRTGDLGMLDDEGFLYFLGRTDDIIKSRGEKVAPREVELALVDVPGVREAAVIGVPDEVLGEAVAAFVVLEDGSDATPRSIRAGCQRRLEPTWVPRHIEIRRELPKTGTGKVSKTALRQE